MKRHLTASTAGAETANERRAGPGATRRARKPQARSGRARHLALASEPPHAHTLVLTGELNQRTAYTLETAIEDLELAAVQDITLDLRKLDRIDPTGVAVIAFHCRLAKRRGYVLSLIPGPAPIHRVFEQAGVAQTLPFVLEEVSEEASRPHLVST
jgi:anti-anti-sigma factor